MTEPIGPLRIESLRDARGEGTAAPLAGLPALARSLHRAILGTFVSSGKAPHLSEVLPGGQRERSEALHQLREVDLIHLDADGHIAVAYPFSSRPTGHRVQLEDGPVLHAMCAIDALGIPLMTGRDALITSTDPDAGQPIRVRRLHGEWTWSPSSTAVLLAQTTQSGPAAACLCPATTFHLSSVAAERHLNNHPELAGYVLAQAGALKVADRSFASMLDGDTSSLGSEPSR
jgi:alkylmercury lyase